MIEKQHKKVLLIDLDGVLNNYQGVFDKDFIPDLKEGAKDFLENLSKKYEVKIFTTRNKLLVAKWLIKFEIDNLISDITNVKDLAWLYIDDRCITFDGNYSKLLNDVENFKVWYK